jgi:hypothetical protein
MTYTQYFRSLSIIFYALIAGDLNYSEQPFNNPETILN